MLLESAGWLDDGDKISSIVSAFISVLLLVITIYQARRPSAKADQPSTSRWRWHLWVAGGCATIATASAALVTWVIPDRFRVVGVVLAGIACLAAIVVVISGAVARLRSLKRLDPALRRLLDAQLSEADFHQYEFGSLSLPGVSLIYVEQRLGAVNITPHKATQILDAKELIRCTPNAIVIGVPGAGKSTLAAHVIGTAARWWTEARVASRVRTSPFGRLIPVLLPAKALADHDIPMALATRWNQASVDAGLFTRDPFRNVKWLIIVDSLDEISAGEARTRVIQRLGSFIASTARAHLIVTTRALTAGELADLTSRGAQEFHLRLFGTDELVKFATNWFRIRGGGHVDATAEAARFISHVRSSRLTSIVRVPLLATMAILVYEGDRDRILPTSRSELYHEFICLLRGSRNAEPLTPFENWLSDNLDDLLAELASAHVREDTPRLLALAITWVQARSPASLLTGPESERIGTLRSALIASGLCVFTPSLEADGDEPAQAPAYATRRFGNDVAFVHLTIAEYLAADPAIYEFSYGTFRTLMASGTTRGFALFTLARGSVDPSKILSALLRDDDLLSAGYVIADGISVDDGLRQQTIDGLMTRITHDHPTVLECVSLLVDLAAAPDVLTRIHAAVGDEKQALWARVVMADALADIDDKIGLDLLRRLVRDAQSSDSDAIWWASQRLTSRVGVTASPEESVPVTPSASSLGEIGRQACRQTATDQHQVAAVRARAASILHAAGDKVGTLVLRSLVVDQQAPAGLRLQMARILATGQDDQGVATLRALAMTAGDGAARIPAEVRRAAASDLMSQGDPAGVEALRHIAVNHELPKTERHQIAVQLAERGDPIGREILVKLDREQARRSAVRQAGGVTLVAGALVALSNGAVMSGTLKVTTALVGLFFFVISMVWQWLENIRVPIRALVRQTQYSPVRAYKSGRRRRGLEYLADAVSIHLANNQRAFVSSNATNRKFINIYLAPRRLRDDQETRLLPQDLADGIAHRHSNPVVILGSPGSGKTQTATTLALDLIARRKAGDVVPVLLSVGTWWASNHRLEDWIVERLVDDYKMSVDEAAYLMARKSILPILDGLDEVSPSQQSVIVSAINTMARRGLTVVITCRSTDYDYLVDAMGGFEQAAIFEIQPVQARDLVSFIMDNVTEEQRKAWTPVIRELEQAPSGLFAEHMDQPLTAMLALQPYLNTGRNPAQLLRQIYSRGRSDADLLDDVLDQYLPNAISTIRPRYSVGKSMLWLRTIAEQVASQGTNEFAWWNLPRLVPARSMSMLLLLAIAVPPEIAITIVLSLTATQWPAMVAAVAVVLGLLIISKNESTRVPGGKSPRESIRVETVSSVLQASTLLSGCTMLTYAGTGKLSDALIVGSAAIGCVWTTHAGRYLLSNIYLALTGLLPLRLIQFLDATTHAGITRQLGPAYIFVHIAIQKHLTSGH